MSPNKLRPAVLGGLLMGVLSALPVIQIGNVCCCLWVILGGVLAAYVMQQGHPYPITIADGAPKRVDGRMTASDQPGLGVTPRFDVLGDPVVVIGPR